MRNDVGSNYKMAEELPAISVVASTVNGAGVDHKDGSSVAFFISCGDVGASGTLDAKIQHSPDGTSWTDDDGSSGNDTAIVQIVAAGVAQLNVNVPLERYSRVVATIGANAVVFGVTSVLGPRRHIAA